MAMWKQSPEEQRTDIIIKIKNKFLLGLRGEEVSLFIMSHLVLLFFNPMYLSP